MEIPSDVQEFSDDARGMSIAHRRMVYIWMSRKQTRKVTGHNKSFKKLLKKMGYKHKELSPDQKKKLAKRTKDKMTLFWTHMVKAGAISQHHNASNGRGRHQQGDTLKAESVVYEPWVVTWRNPGWNGNLHRPHNWNPNQLIDDDSDSSQSGSDSDSSSEGALDEIHEAGVVDRVSQQLAEVFNNSFGEEYMVIPADSIWEALTASISAQGPALGIPVPTIAQLEDIWVQIEPSIVIEENDDIHAGRFAAVLVEWLRRQGVDIRLQLGVMLQNKGEEALYLRIVAGEHREEDERQVETLWIRLVQYTDRPGGQFLYRYFGMAATNPSHDDQAGVTRFN